MKVLAIDVGGTHVKILLSGQTVHRKFDSGPTLTPRQMVKQVIALAQGWKYDAVSIGYPGKVAGNRAIAEPHNLGKGWTKFDFHKAFGVPTKIVNDAAMQALGSYRGGLLLFLGLGTGLGMAMIAEGVLIPTELAHLPYRKGVYEDYLGIRGLEKYGKQKWKRDIGEVVGLFMAALQPDDVVLGGGNVAKLKKLPAGCRVGDNANAFVGGFKLWSSDKTSAQPDLKKKKPV